MTTQIEEVLGAVLTSVRGARVHRLTAKFPVDDDNLWFIRQAQDGPEVQIESNPDGGPPFLIESGRHDRRVYAETVTEALDVIRKWLRDDS